MINAKEAPRYRGFLKIFFVSLLAMVFGFLGGLGALKADALTSSVPPPRSAAQGPWIPALAFPESRAHLRSWPSCQTLRSRSMTRPVAARVKARPQTWLA